VHSVILGVQQDRSTVSAQIVNGVFVVEFAWSPFVECRRAYLRLLKTPPRTNKKRGILKVEVFYATPTRLASILDGLRHQISPQGCCTAVRPL
jgi:hypothetical protein